MTESTSSTNSRKRSLDLVATQTTILPIEKRNFPSWNTKFMAKAAEDEIEDIYLGTSVPPTAQVCYQRYLLLRVYQRKRLQSQTYRAYCKSLT